MKNKKTAQLSPIQEFLKITKTLWGKRWRTKSAEALEVHPTTVWRWTQEGSSPPPVALMALRSLYKQPVDTGKKAG